MPHAIIHGHNGRRHEVDFGDDPIRVEVHASNETVEIFVDADVETDPEDRPVRDPEHPTPPVQRAIGQPARFKK